MSRIRTPFVLSVLLCAAVTAAPAQPRPFTVNELVVLKRISEPQASPDGRQVVFVLRSTDLAANKGRTDLWLTNADGTGLRQLTTSAESESNPRWAPDGRSVFFLSTRGGSSQVWQLRMDGGESRRVTALPLDVESFGLSPDGTRLLVAALVYPDCAGQKGGAMACTSDRLAEKEKTKATGRIYDQLLFRHWDSWADGRRQHLFVVAADGGAAEPVDLMKTMDAHAPSKPFGGPEEYTFTPDGKGVVFTAKDVGREEAWSTNYDLFHVPADGSAAPRRLTAANKAWDTRPMFAPDGRGFVYLAMERAGYEADRFRILHRPSLDGPDREIAKGWDRSPAELAFAPDGRTLYATADDLGHHSLFAIDVASGKVTLLLRDGKVDAVLPAGDRLIVNRNHLRSPNELYTLGTDGKGIKAITAVNADLLAQVAFGEPEQFTFKGAAGDTVHAWIVKPVGFDPAKKWPIAFLVHGGPQGSFGNDFHYRWNPQTYAGRGYAAIMVDFHGSTGYGQKFTDDIRHDWGGKPLEDLKLGLEAAIAKYPWLDGQRACALGASYGGYMINWIAGMWPDRFRCLVTHDGNLDERFAYFDTEELWFPEWEHGGPPWENPEGFAKHNPIDLVKNWKAPMLVVHGGQDFRVVDTQGMATFTAAQRRGIPSRFLHFPDENHWVLKPHNSIQWHETVLAWLDRWTAK